MLCWVQEYLLNSNKFRQEIFNNTGSRKLVGNIKITYNECFWKDLTLQLGFISHTVLKLVWLFSSIVLCCWVLFYLLKNVCIFREGKFWKASGSVCILSKNVSMVFKSEQRCNCSLVVNQGYLYSHSHGLPCLFSSWFHRCSVCRKWMEFSRTCSQSGSPQDSSTWNGSRGNHLVKYSRKLVSKCWRLERVLDEEVMSCLGLQRSTVFKTLLFRTTGKV